MKGWPLARVGDSEMRVWLDTEFTDLQHPKLISIGMATEGGSEVYVELAEGQAGCWAVRDCSEFVVVTVLPLLEPSHAYMAGEVVRRVADFLFRCGVYSRLTPSRA